MSAPKSRCPDCRERTAECVCDDDGVPEAPGALLMKAIFGGAPRKDGPPYEHVHRFPEEPEGAPPPEHVPFSIERDAE